MFSICIRIIIALFLLVMAVMTQNRSITWGMPSPRRSKAFRCLVFVPQILLCLCVALVLGWNWFAFCLSMQITICFFKLQLTIAAYIGAKRALEEALDDKGKLKPSAHVATFHRLRERIGLEEAETEAELLSHPLCEIKSKKWIREARKAAFASSLKMTWNELAIAFATYIIALTNTYATIVLIFLSLAWVALSFYYMSVSFSRKN